MSDEKRGNTLYLALWRWHFYAGLIALPFMISLACTGALYLFKDEINATLFSYRNEVAAHGTMLAPSALVDYAAALISDSYASAYTEPASDTSSALVSLNTPRGKELVWLNPATGAVLDHVPERLEFMTVVKHLHSLSFFGAYANRLIEIVGGFALVLVVTGFYLWWPRGRKDGVVSVRGTSKHRLFWRDLHAVSGAFAGVLIFFLALSGMPWSGFWGARMHEAADAANLGYPKGMWDNVPNSDMHANHLIKKIGWTLSTSPVPKPPASYAAPIGIDQAYRIAKDSGIARGFELNLPQDMEGVYTASVFPDDLARQRLIHIDQYSGKKLVDAGFKDYGGIAKAVELGINLHMGQEWGRFNQVLMLLTCFAIILSSVTAAVMWWKRRPQGRLGVPPQPDKNLKVALLLPILLFGALFPLTGFAILIMIACDMLLIRNIPLLRKVFS